MSTAETDEYWREFIRSQSAVEAARLQHADLVHSQACRALELTHKSEVELRKILLRCSPELNDFVADGLAGSKEGIRVLYDVFQECMQNDGPGGAPEEVASALEQRILHDGPTRSKLVDLREKLKKSTTCAHDRVQEKAAPLTAERIRQEEIARRRRTWRDMPEEEVAERLSKGEIIGRDEWIPGKSGGTRRLLTPAEWRDHREFALKLRKETEAFMEKAFRTSEDASSVTSPPSERKPAVDSESVRMAVLRSTQGVQLLNWVRVDDESEMRELDKLLRWFTLVQARTCFRAKEFRQAAAACNTVLAAEPQDEEAQLLLIEALIEVGDLTAAKSYILKLNRSTHASSGALIKCRELFQRMRAIIYKSDQQLRDVVPRALDAQTFSENRATQRAVKASDGAIPPGAPAPPPAPPAERAPDLFAQLEMVFRDESSPHGGKTLVAAADAAALLETLLESLEQDHGDTLKQLRSAADLEPHRILLRSRAMLADLVPQDMGAAILHWSVRDESVRQLGRELIDALLGDMADA